MLELLQSILHFEAYKLCEPTVKNMYNYEELILSTSNVFQI